VLQYKQFGVRPSMDLDCWKEYLYKKKFKRKLSKKNYGKKNLDIIFFLLIAVIYNVINLKSNTTGVPQTIFSDVDGRILVLFLYKY
jgi:septum formation inhibitor-activating ATPase MinD